MKQKQIEKIIEYLRENEEELEEVLEELDDYEGYLSDSRYYCMEYLNDIYISEHPIEILTRAFYGYDEDTKVVDKWGREEHGAFNPNRNYFYFNGYGNLISTDYKDYSTFLDAYLVEDLVEKKDYLCLDDTLEEMLEELEEMIKKEC